MARDRETILIVEDDASILKGLKMNLELEGYAVIGADDGEKGLALAYEAHPDLVILDVMLPKMNGFEVCKEIRRRKIDVPVLMLSAKNAEIDRIMGLDLGADDYISKPFALREVLARVNAFLRRRRSADAPATMTFGKVTVDFATHQATRDGKPISLTTRELDLVRFFAEHEGKVLSREAILDGVWGRAYEGTDRTVDNFLNRLREKLEPTPDAPRHFLTVRGAGYRFVGSKPDVG
jgi:two-component system, OmpR family, alkaline phosphatase synthesis response regulator PhoP